MRYKVILLLFLLLAARMLLVDYRYQERIPRLMLSEEPLKFTILIQQHSAVNNGVKSSLIYHMLDDFKKQEECKVALSIREDEERHWLALAAGEIDALIINGTNDTVPEIYQDMVVSSIPLNENYDVCVFNRESYTILQSLNHWIAYFRQTPEYKRLVKRYKGGTNNFKSSISPYDLFIRRYCNEIGWDWRLLAALIHTESKFKTGISSARGAIGLMQIKHEIASEFGIEDIYDPEENIRAGVKYIARLQRTYRKMGVDSLNLIPITLAAYNCGEGRMADCMSVARTEGKDPYNWENIKEIIPLMSGTEFKRREDMKLGAFRGKETIAHVEKILKKFESYKVSVRE